MEDIMQKRRRGRPPKDNPMTVRVNVSLTKEEAAILDEYCRTAGVARAQGLRDGLKNLNAKK